LPSNLFIIVLFPVDVKPKNPKFRPGIKIA